MLIKQALLLKVDKHLVGCLKLLTLSDQELLVFPKLLDLAEEGLLVSLELDLLIMNFFNLGVSSLLLRLGLQQENCLAPIF